MISDTETLSLADVTVTSQFGNGTTGSQNNSGENGRRAPDHRDLIGDLPGDLTLPVSSVTQVQGWEEEGGGMCLGVGGGDDIPGPPDLDMVWSLFFNGALPCHVSPFIHFAKFGSWHSPLVQPCLLSYHFRTDRPQGTE